MQSGTERWEVQRQTDKQRDRETLTNRQRRTDGETDGQRDGLTRRRTDREMEGDGWTEKRSDGEMDGQRDPDGRPQGRMDRDARTGRRAARETLKDGRSERWTQRLIPGQTQAWIEARTLGKRRKIRKRRGRFLQMGDERWRRKERETRVAGKGERGNRWRGG